MINQLSNPGRRIYSAARAMVIVAVTVVLAILAVAVPASAANASVSCTTRTTGDKKITTCIHMNISNRKFDLVYGDSVQNRSKHAVRMTCKSESSKTFSWHVDGSAKTSANAIFGKLEASISGGVAGSVTSSYGATVEVTVPARTTMNCDRGIYWYSFSGSIVTTGCYQGYCSTSSQNFKGVAPQRNQWRIYRA